MVSEDALIQQGIRYSDNLFKIIEERVLKALEQSNSLEEFLERTKDFTLQNPMVSTGYQDTMTNLITSITNNVRFERAAQRELVRTAISSRVGELIQNVGDDLKESIRETVKQGYDEGLHSRDIAKRMSQNIQSINSRRARTIARTEVARAYVISDYIVNKERGATGFTVVCRPDCCPICAEDYAGRKNHVPDVDGDGRLIGGNVGFLIDDVGMLPPRHPNSYHKDTQVFTEHGWKYIAELTGDEKLLSLNPDDDSLEFIKPVRLFKHKEPQLVHMHNKWFDVCVTPDHDCFVHKRKDGGKKGRYFEPQFRKPSELNSECHFVRCIDTDRESPEAININGLEFEPSDFAFFMAWYISEGSVLHDVEKSQMRKYPVFIAQQISENREIIQPVLEKMCDYLGLRMNITKNSFVIYSKELYDYLLPLGYSNEKYIPSEVFTLNKECLNIFLDNYVRGDGHERTHGRYNSVERSVFTSSVRLRDDLSYLILLCGYCPSISLHSHKGTIVEHKNGTYTQNYDIYGIRINSSKYTTYSGLTVDCVDYDDYTYCVELPKWHTLWVMRNGKTSWNGNCRCSVNYFRGDGDEIRSKISRKKPTSTATTTTTTSTAVEGQVEEVIEEPQSVNPRIAELEKQISEQQKIADKWRKRGNESLAKTFESTISKLEKELKQLKNPNKPNNSSNEIQNKDLIDDVLTQVLNDIGLGDKAPKTKSESISKNIQTTHESNLWENLAKKHDLELIEASNSFVKYYDKEFDTRIEFNINSNKDWIDYTNSNKKDRNMEEFLKYYKEAPPNYKKASPPIKIIGSAPYDGVCELNTSDIHHIKIARSGYCEMKMQLGSGNLQQTMYHEMSHAFDQRHALDRVRAVMSRGNWWSSQKGGIYKKSTTKDRRNRKKTGGKQFVSEYARTGSSGGNLTEDMAELGSIVAMRDLKDKSNAYLYEYNEQGEYVKVYYDELKKRYPNKWNALEHEIFEGDIVW